MLGTPASSVKLRVLIESATNPDARNCRVTLLRSAAVQDDVATALVPLEAGANPMARARQPLGWTPLRFAE